MEIFYGYHFNKDITRQYSFYLSGKNGRTDYLYDNTYLARNYSNQKYLLSRQNDNSYGGFKVMDTTLISDNWMISNNFKIDIPKLPIGLFADFEFSVLVQVKIKLNGNLMLEYMPVSL